MFQALEQICSFTGLVQETVFMVANLIYLINSVEQTKCGAKFVVISLEPTTLHLPPLSEMYSTCNEGATTDKPVALGFQIELEFGNVGF